MHRKTSKPVNITRAGGQEVYHVLYIHITATILGADVSVSEQLSEEQS